MSRWADLDGPVHYVDHGGPEPVSGPVAVPLVVCVHGLGGSSLNWDAIAPQLARTYRVLALDLPGHGRTQACGRSTSVTADQRLLHRFITEVAGGPALLIGNSMGGMISILEAAARPEAVTGLVLVDPALPQLRITGRNPMVALSFLANMLPGLSATILAGRRRRTTPEEGVARMLRLCCVDPARIPPDLIADSVQLSRERLSYPGANGDVLAAARSLVRILLAHRGYEAKMRAIEAPVLLIHGDRDRLVSLASARIAAAANPAWRFEIARGVGHVPQLEAPEWTLATILDWMTADTGLVGGSSAS